MIQVVQFNSHFIHTKSNKMQLHHYYLLELIHVSLDMVLYFIFCCLVNLRSNLSCSLGTTFRLPKVSRSEVQSHIRRHWQGWMMVDVCHTCQKVFCHPFPRSHTLIWEAKVANVPIVVRCRALHSSQLITQKKTCLDFHMERSQIPFRLCFN